MDKTNRFKRQDKREAYEHALELARQQEKLDQLAIFRQLDPDLSREDRRQVAAKAVRVVRGRRMTDRYITLNQAFLRFGVPQSTLRYHANIGSFTAFKQGKTWLAEVGSLTEWLSSRGGNS